LGGKPRYFLQFTSWRICGKKKLVGFFDAAKCGSEVYVVLKPGDFYLLEEWC